MWKHKVSVTSLVLASTYGCSAEPEAPERELPIQPVNRTVPYLSDAQQVVLVEQGVLPHVPTDADRETCWGHTGATREHEIARFAQRVRCHSARLSRANVTFQPCPHTLRTNSQSASPLDLRRLGRVGGGQPVVIWPWRRADRHVGTTSSQALGGAAGPASFWVEGSMSRVGTHVEPC